MILVLFAYCIAGGVHAEKIRKSTVRSLMQQPTTFSATPLSTQGSYGDECQACSSRVLGEWTLWPFQFSSQTDIEHCKVVVVFKVTNI